MSNFTGFMSLCLIFVGKERHILCGKLVVGVKEKQKRNPAPSGAGEIQGFRKGHSKILKGN